MKRLWLLPLLATTAIAADDTPAWLKAALAEKMPAVTAKTPAVVLLNESSVSVDETGKVVTTDHYAVRIVNRAGTGWARAAKPYTKDTGKVRDMKAWIVPATGTPRRLEKEKFFDVSMSDDALYEDVRARVVRADREIDPGAVFAYESIVEDKAIFTQFSWEFSDRLPTIASRFSLTLPPGWSAKAVTLNHAEIPAVESGSTRTWEIRDLPLFEDEPASPGSDSLRPRLGVSFYAPPGSGNSAAPSFTQWVDVSKWLSTLHDPQATPDEAITAKVRELTAGLVTPEAKVRAIAGYVQNIRYVSIQTGIGRGGGYKPHTAAMVFAKSYGDCKDKANLLRAMLKVVGVESWPVTIFSGDLIYVKEVWATPHQFNHCILAIAIGGAFPGGAVLDDPKLGKLLFFDPTDAFTPIGEIPVHEQASLALVLAGDNGTLKRMPAAAADANLTTRHIEATLGADGAISGEMHEELHGWTAVVQRAQLRERGDDDYRKRVESRITARLRSAAVTELHTADKLANSQFSLDLKFASGTFAQLMQGRLMVFQPSVIEAVDPLPFSNPKRVHPAVINARGWRDSVTVKLPAGFEVDEIPNDLRTDSSFGTYEASVKVKNGVLTFTRTLSLKSTVVAPEDYKSLKEFSDKVGAGDQAPVVLIRK